MATQKSSSRISEARSSMQEPNNQSVSQFDTLNTFNNQLQDNSKEDQILMQQIIDETKNSKLPQEHQNSTRHDQQTKIQPMIIDKTSQKMPKKIDNFQITMSENKLKQWLTLIDNIQHGKNIDQNKYKKTIDGESSASQSSTEDDFDAYVCKEQNLFSQNQQYAVKNRDFNSLLKNKVENAKCIILQNNKFKLAWDLIIMAILGFISIVLPYRLAFYDEDPSIAWMTTWLIIDFLFLVDLILTFMTTFTDHFTNVEVTNHKRIAIKYLKGWFFIDFLSILPFEIMFDGKQQFNTIARVSRTARLYKMIRLLRLFKIFKLAKTDKKIVANYKQKMKISYGTERLVYFTLGFFVFVHVFSCIYIIISQIEEDVAQVWTDKCNVDQGEYKDFENYICSIYFVLTTVATVGYGDISPSTSYERVYCMFLMFMGVISFSFLAGQLGSIMQNVDNRESAIMDKVLQLNQLQNQYQMSEELISNIRKEMNFDQERSEGYLENIYKDLPTGLRVELMCVVHEETFSKFPMFQKCGNKFFISWVSSNLSPRLGSASSIIYCEGDLIEDFYFSIKGVSAFIKDKQNNQIIGIIDPQKTLQIEKKVSKSVVFQSFGCEDAVYNHLLMLIKIDKGQQDEIQKDAENCLNQRRFTVECITQCEYLTLSHVQIDKMKKNFHQPSRTFYKFQIEQFRVLLTVNNYCVAKFQKKMLNKDFQKTILFNQTTNLGYIKESCKRINQFASSYKNVFWYSPQVIEEMKWSSSDEDDDQTKHKKLVKRKTIQQKSYSFLLQPELIVSNKAEKSIMKLVNNFKGHSRLAQVLLVLKKDKKEQPSLSSKLQQQILKQIEESFIESLLIKELPKKKLLLLENLIAEQHFKIWINSLNRNERALQEFSANQEKILINMQTSIENNSEQQKKALEVMQERFENRILQLENKFESKQKQLIEIIQKRKM